VIDELTYVTIPFNIGKHDDVEQCSIRAQNRLSRLALELPAARKRNLLQCVFDVCLPPVVHDVQVIGRDGMTSLLSFDSMDQYIGDFL